MINKNKIEKKVQEIASEITCGGHDRVYAADGNGKIIGDVTYEEVCDYLRSLIDWAVLRTK